MNTHRNRAALAALAGIIAAAVMAFAEGGGDARLAARHAGRFAFVEPRPTPSSWSMLRTPGFAVGLPMPNGWRPVHGDAGTLTAELRGRHGAIAGYLNVTPKEGSETLASWSGFRPAHDREEGDRDVRLLASAEGLRFAGGTGSCVLDSYRTSSAKRYREIACIVAGRSQSAVIVAAASPSRWTDEAPILERAITSFEI